MSRTWMLLVAALVWVLVSGIRSSPRWAAPDQWAEGAAAAERALSRCGALYVAAGSSRSPCVAVLDQRSGLPCRERRTMVCGFDDPARMRARIEGYNSVIEGQPANGPIEAQLARHARQRRYYDSLDQRLASTDAVEVRHRDGTFAVPGSQFVLSPIERSGGEWYLLFDGQPVTVDFPYLHAAAPWTGDFRVVIEDDGVTLLVQPTAGECVAARMLERAAIVFDLPTHSVIPPHTSSSGSGPSVGTDVWIRPRR